MNTIEKFILCKMLNLHKWTSPMMRKERIDTTQKNGVLMYTEHIKMVCELCGKENEISKIFRKHILESCTPKERPIYINPLEK